MTVTFTAFGPPMVPVPPVFDRRINCPACGVARVGVRVIHAELAVLAPHSEGQRRISKDRPRCQASELNVSGVA